MAGFEDADCVEGGLQRGFSDGLLEAVLYAVEGGDGAQGGSFASRLERQQSAASVGGVDLALHQTLCLQRRDGVADVAARGGEGLGQLRGLDGARGLEEDGGQNKTLHEAETVGGEGLGGDAVKVMRRALDGKHRTLAEVGFDAHGQ